MPIRYLKSRKDGWIFEWDPILEKNPSLYEITEQEAFPERFIPEKQVEMVVEAKKTKKRKGFKFVEETQDNFPPEEELDSTPIELAIEAAKGWPK